MFRTGKSRRPLVAETNGGGKRVWTIASIYAFRGNRKERKYREKNKKKKTEKRERRRYFTCEKRGKWLMIGRTDSWQADRKCRTAIRRAKSCLSSFYFKTIFSFRFRFRPRKLQSARNN